jgi:cell wall-associated NlpC family hydrolase
VRRFITLFLTGAVLFGAAPADARPLQVGSHGKAVRAVQQRLGLPVDGIYGEATARAVRRFQRRHDLNVTGRVGAATRRAMGFGTTPSRTSPTTGGAQSPDESTTMADAARSALGSTYREGGTGPDEFDASGLVYWAAAAAGIDLPRSTFTQYQAGTAVARDDVTEGDLVFFDTNGPGASDVGIAIDSDTAISATTHGVREHVIFGPYWGEHYVGARRIG